MLDEFRTLGGTAENIRLGHGARGRGLFPIDPSQPVTLQVPPNLLMDVDDVVFENGALKLASDAEAGTRERRFFEDYQADFAWGGGGRGEVETLLEEALALPEELRRELCDRFRCGAWFEDHSEALVRRLAQQGRSWVVE